MKTWTRRILALLMAAGLLLTGFAAAEEPAADQPEGGMRFTLRTEEMARSETGMDIRDWEMQTEVRRLEGQAAAVTREDLTQADPAVRIYEDKGQIYMIDGLAESLPTGGLEHVQLTHQEEAAETDAAEAGSEAPETASAGADAAQQEP